MATAGAAKPKPTKKQDPASNQDLFESKSTSEMLASTHTAELVIALCGPIGSPLHGVAEKLKEKLEDMFDYDECKVIRLSDFIAEHAARVGVKIPEENGYARITKQIEAGNALRQKDGLGVLAELAVAKIRVDREAQKEQSQSQHYEPRRVCHIIDSIKNQEEFDLLKLVYREMVYFLGVFAPIELREANLNAKGLKTGDVYQLIDRDSGEESNYGQTVRNTFPQCDFFLRIDSSADTQLDRKVERFLHLILGTKIITPTSHESAMYAAASAATNSACLSRQVGAAICNELGEVVSVGWNDVPRFNGGLYTANPRIDPNSELDRRCWNHGGKCYNDDEKNALVDHLSDVLDGIVAPEDMDSVRSALKKSSKLQNLIEFSRSVHAEMHAIINAGNLADNSLRDSTLFVTTYPCHSCARHIIAAGITTVYYIEPYRKSLAIKLHGDAMTEKESEGNKVKLLPYDGVAPTKYLALFRMKPDSRKDKFGKVAKVLLSDGTPRLEKSMEALPALEGVVIESLRRKQLLPISGKSDNEPPDGSTAA